MVILCEPQFKPSIEDQAVARAHRMGQNRVVAVYRLLAKESVDDALLTRLGMKARLFDRYARTSVVAEATDAAIDARGGRVGRGAGPGPDLHGAASLVGVRLVVSYQVPLTAWMPSVRRHRSGGSARIPRAEPLTLPATRGGPHGQHSVSAQTPPPRFAWSAPLRRRRLPGAANSGRRQWPKSVSRRCGATRRPAPTTRRHRPGPALAPPLPPVPPVLPAPSRVPRGCRDHRRCRRRRRGQPPRHRRPGGAGAATPSRPRSASWPTIPSPATRRSACLRPAARSGSCRPRRRTRPGSSWSWSSG